MNCIVSGGSTALSTARRTNGHVSSTFALWCSFDHSQNEQATHRNSCHQNTHTYPGAPTGFFPGGHRWWKGSVVGGTMASAEHKPITGVQGQSPRLGGQGAKPPEAESILVIGCPTGPANLAPFQKCICISTLGATVMIWEKFVEIQGVHVTPLTPSWGRPCRPTIVSEYTML